MLDASLVSGLQSGGQQKCATRAKAVGKPLRFSGPWVWGQEVIDLQALTQSPLGRGGHRNGQSCLLELRCSVLPEEVFMLCFYLLLPFKAVFRLVSTCPSWIQQMFSRSFLPHGW